jgi:hypothetical protein
MKMRILVFVGLFAASCATSARFRTDDLVEKYPISDPEKIEVYSLDDVGRPYVKIGAVVVSADAGGNADISVRQLKREAAQLGADAIINLRLEIGYGYWTNAVRSSGTAVKFIN